MSDHLIGPTPVSVALSLAVALLGLALLCYRRRTP